MIRLRKTSGLLAVTAITALAGGSLPLLTAESASAASCLRTVGQIKSLVADGQHIGVFYQGFDQCNKTAYAELHFDTSHASSEVTSTDPYTDNDIEIEHFPDGSPGISNRNLPRGALYWDAGSVSVEQPDGEYFNASTHFYYWTGSHIAECYAVVGWDYSDGSDQGASVNCNDVD
ncbi:hypothetical protein ACIOC1_35405 [Streptomyces sp. NPDC088197]|uniref:hypothetical protein n=1 Tax=Streptomyces sp. NPDC088197 TaxID=3365840 RepID=UPI00380AF66F